MEDANGIAGYLLTLLLGTIGGAVGTLVTLRTKLAMIDRDIRDEQKARQRLEAELKEIVGTLERRQLASLKLTASIARKVGADARFDDALVRMLGEE